MRKGSIAIIYNIVQDDKEGYYKDVSSVEDALKRLGYDVTKIPVGDDILGSITRIKEIKPDGIFNLCEGINGDSWGEVYVAGILEILKIPYTGSGPVPLAVSLDKAKTKDLLRSHNIQVPAYKVFNIGEEVFLEGLKFPLIVKPLYEDGSYGIDCDSVVDSENTLLGKINAIHKIFREPAIVEEYIDGRELNVSILDNNNVLPISEIDYRDMPLGYPRIVSYKAKWDGRSVEYRGTVPVCPADLSIQLEEKIKRVSVKAYRIMGCRDYARIDIRLDKNENLYIIDVNPNPCLSPDSGFVRSAGTAGFSYTVLIGRILDMCMERSGARSFNPQFITTG